jgi:hypothetical protein
VFRSSTIDLRKFELEELTRRVGSQAGRADEARRAPDPADGAMHWSTRKLAEQLGISHPMVARVWRKRALRPHRLDGYMASSERPFTPTCFSWLNQARLRFSTMERDAIARDIFTSLPHVKGKLMC